jgi:hypothetical protein
MGSGVFRAMRSSTGPGRDPRPSHSAGTGHGLAGDAGQVWPGLATMVPWHGTLAALARSGAGAGKGRVPYRL